MSFTIKSFEFEELDFFLNFSVKLSKPKTDICFSNYVKEQLDLVVSFLNYQYGKVLDGGDITTMFSESALNKQQSEYNDKLEQLRNQLVSLQEKNDNLIRERSRTVEDYERKLQSIRSELSDGYLSESRVLKDDLEAVRSENHGYLTQINDLNRDIYEMRSKLDMLSVEKERDVLRMESDFKVQMSKMEENYKMTLINSSKKGAASEVCLMDYLVSVFNTSKGYTIYNVGSVPQLCDIAVLDGNNMGILMENKAYNRNVPTCEVDKFVRDIKSPNYTGFCDKFGVRMEGIMGGIFLSKDTSICNKKDVDFDIIDGKLVFYLSKYSETYEMIPIFYDIIHKFYTNTKSLGFWDKLENIDIIKKIIEDINEDKRLFGMLITSMNDNMDLVNKLRMRILGYSNKMKSMFMDSSCILPITTTKTLQEQVLDLFGFKLTDDFIDNYGYCDLDLSHYIKTVVVRGESKYSFTLGDGKFKANKYDMDNRVEKLQIIIKKLIIHFDM